MNELVLSPEPQSDHSTFQRANGPNDRLCPPLFPGKLINPIVVSCLDRTEFCDWIQHFKAADVPVLSPPPPVYDIIYTPTHREVRRALLKPPCGSVGGGIKSNKCKRNRSISSLLLCYLDSTVQQVERSQSRAQRVQTIERAWLLQPPVTRS